MRDTNAPSANGSMNWMIGTLASRLQRRPIGSGRRPKPVLLGTNSNGENSPMLRTPQPDDTDVETLLEERDTLRIRLSLALDAPSPDDERVRQLRKAIFELEDRIKAQLPRV